MSCCMVGDHGRLLMMVIGAIALLMGRTSLAPATPTTQPNSPPNSPQPDPKLRPEDVVRIVVESLGNNDAADNGIRTTWKFSSPANKQFTGPLERFIPMVKTPAYAPMLQRTKIIYGKVEMKDDSAIQLVVLVLPDGKQTAYLFQLSRQTDGDLKGCWMTDGVSPIKPPPNGVEDGQSV